MTYQTQEVVLSVISLLFALSGCALGAWWSGAWPENIAIAYGLAFGIPMSVLPFAAALLCQIARLLWQFYRYDPWPQK